MRGVGQAVVSEAWICQSAKAGKVLMDSFGINYSESEDLQLAEPMTLTGRPDPGTAPTSNTLATGINGQKKVGKGLKRIED